MTVVTVYSSRLKDDPELVPRSVRNVLSSLGLTQIRVVERIDPTVALGSHRVVVRLPPDNNVSVQHTEIAENLKRLFNHAPPRREVSVEVEATEE